LRRSNLERPRCELSPFPIRPQSILLTRPDVLPLHDVNFLSERQPRKTRWDIRPSRPPKPAPSKTADPAGR